MQRKRSPKLTPQQVAYAARFVADYINAQRQRFSAGALSLTRSQRSKVGSFFLPQVLDAARVLMLYGESIENPPYYPFLAEMGFPSLPDFSGMYVITFRDVVVTRMQLADSSLFIELVHAEQYRQLGVLRFWQLYLSEFFSRPSIATALQSHAYYLESKFSRNPEQRFSVADEVADWVTKNGRC